jgi:hypothetical protein
MSESDPKEKFSLLQSVTRLVVGGLIIVLDAVDARLRSWEGQAVDELHESDWEPPAPEAFDPLPNQLPAPGAPEPKVEKSTGFGYAIIGLIFEGEEQLEKWLSITEKTAGAIGQKTAPLLRPLSKIPNPAGKAVNQLAQRGQSALDRWEHRGREEADRGRQLAEEVTTNTVGDTISYMAQNPAVGDLIQEQGVSLGRQILELVRALNVSADVYFEGLVRYLFRRRPRYLLPPPSLEIQKQATWTLQDIRHGEENEPTK